MPNGGAQAAQLRQVDGNIFTVLSMWQAAFY
jgi:hypothetical protein